ncbi:MAG: RidA family protein [Firmicutes bacterium]|nr:RidA family protein [Bacillota bacterium]
MDGRGQIENKLYDIGHSNPSVETKLRELGYILPNAPKKAGVYMPVKVFAEKMAYVSGCLPITDDKLITGKLGADCSMEDGCKAAELCTLNILAILKEKFGDLAKIKSCTKMTVLVASTADFYQQSQIANSATELLVKAFGEEIGCPSRAAFGVASLPLNAAVEIELLVELV